MKNKLFWLGIVTISAVLLGVFSTQRLTVEAGENGHGGTHREWSYYWGEWSECRTKSDETCGETLRGWKTRTLYRECVWTRDGDDECKLGEVQETERTERRRCVVELPVCPTPTPEPTESPEPTPEPIEPPRVEIPLGVAGAPTCDGVPFVQWPGNPHVLRNGDTATVRWVPTQGSQAHVYYFEVQNPANEHAVRDTENDGEVVITLLGSRDWTFGVQQKDGCAASGITWIEDGNAVRMFLPTSYSWFK